MQQFRVFGGRGTALLGSSMHLAACQQRAVGLLVTTAGV